MKYLHLFTEWIESVLGNKQPDQLNVKKELLQKILTELQHSGFLWGESRWQTLLAASLAELKESGQHRRRLQAALQQADDLMDEARITEKVRKVLLDQVRRRVLLEESQIKNYEITRRECLVRQVSLHELENKIDGLLNESRQMIGEPSFSKTASLFNLNNQSFVEILKPYPKKMLQVRFSDNHIRDWIKGEGNAREVYQSLSREFLKKSATEKAGEDIQKAKNSLQNHAEKIEIKLDRCRKDMVSYNRRTIEHRAQVMLAHANKIESISLSLATMTHLLRSHVKCPCLFKLMTEIQMMQKLMNTNAESTDLQRKLLAIHDYRKDYEKSITSVWGTLFNRRQSQYQQQLNTHLQLEIAKLVTPVCGFNDRNTIIKSEKIRQIQKSVNKLAVQQGHIADEKVKIDQIKNTFQS